MSYLMSLSLSVSLFLYDVCVVNLFQNGSKTRGGRVLRSALLCISLALSSISHIYMSACGHAVLMNV